MTTLDSSTIDGFDSLSQNSNDGETPPENRSFNENRSPQKNKPIDESRTYSAKGVSENVKTTNSDDVSEPKTLEGRTRNPEQPSKETTETSAPRIVAEIGSTEIVSFQPLTNQKNDDDLASNRLEPSLDSASTQFLPEIIDSEVVGVSVESTESIPNERKNGDSTLNPDDSGRDQTIISDAPPIRLQTPDPNLVESTEQVALPNQIYSDAALPIGTTLGHFSITKYIGGGGMGRVYEAIDQSLDRKVAVKVLPRQRAQDRSSVARFLNEAKSAARLNHEHIAQVYFCGEDHGIPYIAFEYVEGTNIRTYVEQNGVIPLPEAINFILQITSAIAHASAHGVTHRDVKPSNILITPQGQAKLIDMGLARLLKPTDPNDDLTASGVTLGTFDYISPEQARDPRNADVRSDVYSLGCTFFFMLTGRPPFPEGTVLQKLLQHQGDVPPDVRDFAPNIPVEVSTVVQKMMAKNPKDRFQDPKILMSVLVEIAEMVGLQRPGPGQAVWILPTKSKSSFILRHMPWTAAVAILFLGVILVDYWGTPKTDVSLPDVFNSRWNAPSVVETVKPSDPVSNEPKVAPVESPTQEASFVPYIRVLTASIWDEMMEKRLPRSTGSDVGAGSLGGYKGGSSKDLQPIRLAGGLDVEPISSTDFLARLESQTTSEEYQKTADFLARPVLTNSFQLWFEPYTDSTASDSTTNLTNSGSTQSLIVDLTGELPGTYATIQAAINAGVAASGTNNSTEIAIELRFNGSAETGALSITNRKIKIFGSTGFRPLLTFYSNDSQGNGGERLFLLNSTELTLQNLGIDFVVPGQEIAAREWSVFELFNDSRVNIFDATITVQNATSSTNFAPSHSNVAFVRNNVSDPSSERAGGVPAITINHSLVRGEAVLFYCKRNAAGSVEINDSGVYVNGILYFDDTELTPTVWDLMKFKFDGSIILSRTSLFRRIREESRQTLPIRVELLQSLIKLNDLPLGTTASPKLLDDANEIPAFEADRSIFLDATGLWRFRSRQQPSETKDYPFVNQNIRTLASLSLNANDEFESIAPHSFSSNDFYRLIFVPVGNNGINSSNEYQTIDEMRKQLFSAPPFQIFP